MSNGDLQEPAEFEPVGTRYPELFAMLAAPFEPLEIRQRQKTKNPADGYLSYITARTAMNRFDNVVGPEYWEDTYETFGDGGVQCHLKVTLPDGRKIVKSGLGGVSQMSDSSNDEKGGESAAFKRAAVKFGVGRYLYMDGVPTFVAERTGQSGPSIPFTPEAERIIAAGSPRPVQEPAPSARRDEPRREPDREPARPQNGHSGPPRTGRALYAWTLEMEKEHDVQLLKYLNSFAKIQEWPGRMIDFSAEQVALAHAEAVRKLAFVEQGNHSHAESHAPAY